MRGLLKLTSSLRVGTRALRVPPRCYPCSSAAATDATTTATTTDADASASASVVAADVSSFASGQEQSPESAGGQETPQQTSYDALATPPPAAGHSVVESVENPAVTHDVPKFLEPKTPPAPEYEGEPEILRSIRLHNSSMWGLKGQVVSGEILAVGKDYVVVDLGFKALSRFFKKELSTSQIYATTEGHKLKRKAGVFFKGDRLRFRIEDLESPYGDMHLTAHKLHETIRRDLVWKELKEAFQAGNHIQGRILNPVDRGIAVGIGGFVAFCPLTQQIRPHVLHKIGVLQLFKIARMDETNGKRSIVVLSAEQSPFQRRNPSNFGSPSARGGFQWGQ